MWKATGRIDPDRSAGPVNRRTFGSFVEHMGRCVYGGIYEPDHPRANERGFRTDVLELVRELGVTTVRYPGGNYVSGYRWEAGIGPRQDRPRRLDTAWHSVETNEFGLGEFVKWASLADVEIMLAVNLGTRGVQEAVDLVEYANHPGGTHLSDLRRQNGDQDPYGIRLWCLGNEMDGPWQMGHKTAHEYARLATETARAMRMVDPSLELVACGSSTAEMPTFGAWEATVLEHAYEQVDYISAHAYYEKAGEDLSSFLSSSIRMQSFIDSVTSTCDAVKAKTRSKKSINISFDEWNVWYLNKLQDGGVPTDWVVAPALSEDSYDLSDAVVVGSLLITLLRNSERVKVACQAQLVNTIAPIRAEPKGAAWRQTIFYPFADMATRAKGTVVKLDVAGPTVHSDLYGEVGAVDAVCTMGTEPAEAVIFCINRSQLGSIDLAVDVRALPMLSRVEHRVMGGDDPFASNSVADPGHVVPRTASGARLTNGQLEAQLPPLSWNVLHLRA